MNAALKVDHLAIDVRQHRIGRAKGSLPHRTDKHKIGVVFIGQINQGRDIKIRCRNIDRRFDVTGGEFIGFADINHRDRFLPDQQIQFMGFDKFNTTFGHSGFHNSCACPAVKADCL